MNINLSHKHAIVCGSSRGIGRAVAIELAQLGASVTLIARDEQLLNRVKIELKSTEAQNHHVLTIDFSNPSQLKDRISEYLLTSAPIHILVNNTGGPPPGLAHEADPQAFLQAFTNHLIGNQIVTQAVIPGMKQAKYGRIINIISTSVKEPISGLGVSNTIRGAVASWAKTLSRELGQFGITVNNILPGYTTTDRLASLIAKKAEARGITSEQMASDMMAGIPARRFADPSETANAVAFLASPAAAYINGINLPVDGGRLSCL